jgi:type I restriction enzyme S subunit
MIDGLKPYPAMKDSGVPWLGNVPEQWKVRRLKYLLRERDVRSSTGTEQLLRVSQFTGVTERRRGDGGDEPDTRAESLVGYKLVAPEDLVVNIMLAWNGSMGVSRFPGIASPAYCVYRFSVSTQPWYFHQLLRSPAYKARIKTVSTGVVESRLRLYSDDLYRLEGLLPPLSEQAAIARFLDHADRRIRRYIRAKQKLIGLLEEQKRAIIHRAVTRGLGPNTRLKPSGVEWLGDVPEHWEVVLNQRIFKEEIRPHHGETEVQLSLSQRSGLIPKHEMEERSLQTSSFDNWKVTVPGDLVLNRFKAHLGVFFASTLRGKVSFHYGVFVPRRPLETRYFELLFHTNAYRTIYAGRSNGMTVGLQNLSNQNFYNVRSIVPPLEEQRAIVAYADKATMRLQQTLKSALREIDLLREFRTRLIADVVTGKLDVREAVARLPDEAEEPEPLDEIEAEGDTEEAGANDANVVPEEAEA